MKSNWPASIKALIRHEGGYVNHPKDPGAATNFGITIHTLRKWRGNPLLTAAEVKALSVREAMQIYKAWYWDALSCDALPSGVDYAVFDYGVNAGPSQAARTLQRAVGAVADGQIGPRTVQASLKADKASLISRYTTMRLEFLMGLKTWATFGRGWKRRVLEVNAKALSMG